MSQVARPELLAPAGDWEAMRAAVANGADAVYFGLSQFNARHRAANFGRDELPEVMKYLHRHNVRGYVAFNTLIFSDELPEAVEFIKTIAAAGADAVIVQDLGLARLIKKICPSLPVHGSTQMTLTEPRGIEFVRRLGVERVILARELSIADIRKIVPQTPMPLEVFVHGALCVAYSGQCLTSEALGGRSANRGQCAQACRMPYELIVDGEKRDLGDISYLLSPQDLAAYDLVSELAALGVVSFKIEGRLKGAPYVAQTTKTYRAAIDAAIEEKPFELSDGELRDLTQVYSRGFAPGFLRGVNHQQLVQGRFPKSRGLRLGVVERTSNRGVVVRLDSPDLDIKPGDGVVFDEGRPEEKEPGGRVFETLLFSSAGRGSGVSALVELRFAHEALDPSTVKVGSIAWKTDDPALRKRLEATFANDRAVHRTRLKLRVSGRPSEALRVALTDDAGHRVEDSWPGPLQPAHTQPVTTGSLREQFGRLGDTPFRLSEIEIDLPEPVMAPRSVLNDLRRRMVAALLEQRHIVYPIAEPDALARLREKPERVADPLAAEPALHVLVRTFEQLDAALKFKPATVYCEFEDIRRYREAVARARDAGVPVGLAALRIIKPGEEGFLRTVGEIQPDFVLIRNLAALEIFRDEFPGVRRIGDFALNVANDLTAELFLSQGLERITPSYDLNWEQFAALVARVDPSRLETVVHQHMPMFHNEHCVFAATLSNGKDHRDCGRPCDRHRLELRDHHGANFPLLADAGCRNTVYNSVPQSAAEFLPRMLALGLRHFRVEFVRESAAQTRALLDQYRRVLCGEENGRDLWRQLRALNQLGVTRGTLQLV
jgi:putative protease